MRSWHTFALFLCLSTAVNGVALSQPSDDELIKQNTVSTCTDHGLTGLDVTLYVMEGWTGEKWAQEPDIAETMPSYAEPKGCAGKSTFVCDRERAMFVGKEAQTVFNAQFGVGFKPLKVLPLPYKFGVKREASLTDIVAAVRHKMQRPTNRLALSLVLTPKTNGTTGHALGLLCDQEHPPLAAIVQSSVKHTVQLLAHELGHLLGAQHGSDLKDDLCWAGSTFKKGVKQLAFCDKAVPLMCKVMKQCASNMLDVQLKQKAKQDQIKDNRAESKAGDLPDVTAVNGVLPKKSAEDTRVDLASNKGKSQVEKSLETIRQLQQKPSMDSLKNKLLSKVQGKDTAGTPAAGGPLPQNFKAAKLTDVSAAPRPGRNSAENPQQEHNSAAEQQPVGLQALAKDMEALEEDSNSAPTEAKAAAVRPAGGDQTSKLDHMQDQQHNGDTGPVNVVANNNAAHVAKPQAAPAAPRKPNPEIEAMKKELKGQLDQMSDLSKQLADRKAQAIKRTAQAAVAAREGRVAMRRAQVFMGQAKSKNMRKHIEGAFKLATEAYKAAVQGSNSLSEALDLVPHHEQAAEVEAQLRSAQDVVGAARALKLQLSDELKAELERRRQEQITKKKQKQKEKAKKEKTAKHLASYKHEPQVRQDIDRAAKLLKDGLDAVAADKRSVDPKRPLKTCSRVASQAVADVKDGLRKTRNAAEKRAFGKDLPEAQKLKEKCDEQTRAVNEQGKCGRLLKQASRAMKRAAGTNNYKVAAHGLAVARLRAKQAIKHCQRSDKSSHSDAQQDTLEDMKEMAQTIIDDVDKAKIKLEAEKLKAQQTAVALQKAAAKKALKTKRAKKTIKQAKKAKAVTSLKGVCTFSAGTAPPGWKNVGKAGMILNKAGYKKNPFGTGAWLNSGWRWTHPSLVCGESQDAKIDSLFVFAKKCPSGSKDMGLYGIIMRKSDYKKNPFHPGGGFNRGWKWIHPHLCRVPGLEVAQKAGNCLLAKKCSSGWQSKGVVGVILSKHDYRFNPFGRGGDLNRGWRWTHPQLCCATDKLAAAKGGNKKDGRGVAEAEDDSIVQEDKESEEQKDREEEAGDDQEKKEEKPEEKPEEKKEEEKKEEEKKEEEKKEEDEKPEEKKEEEGKEEGKEENDERPTEQQQQPTKPTEQKQPTEGKPTEEKQPAEGKPAEEKQGGNTGAALEDRIGAVGQAK